MKNILLKHHSGQYTIEVGKNSLARIGDKISSFSPAKSFCPIITDQGVPLRYHQTLQASLAEHHIQSQIFVIPKGEKGKSFKNYQIMCEKLLSLKLERKSQLIALGGGVVGDLTGFLAATLLRGIDFHQIPTTLLAQVDSSVGGKTGINSAWGKNLIGAFHQPLSVTIDSDTLDTISPKHWRAGFAEIIKYGLINDVSFFTYLENNIDKIVKRDTHIMEEIIAYSCQKKAEIVANDEKERGQRALLNLGHTFGHALESLYHYKYISHGEAVGFGLVLAYDFAFFLKNDPHLKDAVKRIKKINKAVGLATSFKDLPLPKGKEYKSFFDAKTLVDFMKNDKKNENNTITFILPEKLGKTYIDRTISREKIEHFMFLKIHE